MAIFNTVPPLKAGAGIKFDGETISTGAAPRNLLDNSDFRNPVNQRGIISTTENGEFIDRWRIFSTTESNRVTSIDSTGLTTAGGSTVRQIVPAQITPKDISEYTLAACKSDGKVTIFYTLWRDSNGDLVCSIRDAGTYIWAALYEGVYTSDNLPEYQPKGYGAELAECLRYFQRIGDPKSEVLGDSALMLSGSSAFICSVSYYPKRLINPTVKLSNVGNYRALMHHAESGVPYGYISIASFDNIYTTRTQAKISVNVDRVVEENSIAFLQRQDNVTQAYIDICADL